MNEDEKPDQSTEPDEAGAVADDPIAAENEGATGSELDTLRLELEQARDAVTKAKEDVLLARAEAENVRKRAERDVASAHKFGLERFIGNLLPIKDSMDLGFDALDSVSDVESIREGMSLTAKMFDDALEKAGITAIEPLGESFNPEFHQAMTMQPSTEAAPGTILAVMQKGYLLNERLVRPAMVVVAKALEEDG